MAVTIKTIGANVTEKDDLVKIIKDVFADLEDQLNTRAQVYISTNGVIPAGLIRNDTLIVDYKGRITFQVKNAKGFDTLTAEMLGGLTAHTTNFLGLVQGTTAPAITNFPDTNDWGFYAKTTATTSFSLCYNFNGVLKKIALT